MVLPASTSFSDWADSQVNGSPALKKPVFYSELSFFCNQLLTKNEYEKFYDSTIKVRVRKPAFLIKDISPPKSMTV